MSPLLPSGAVVGTLTRTASEATGLPEGLPVVNGAHDQYCAAIACGVLEPGSVLLSCGTAWIILLVPPTLEAALKTGLGISCHAQPNRWGAIGSLSGVGRCVEWLLDTVWWRGERNVGPKEDLYAAFSASAAESPAGANGLLFVPIVGGYKRFKEDRGGFFGLAPSHTRADLARSALEGITLELARMLQAVHRAGVEASALTLVGGAAHSSVWPQIITDVTGVPVTIPPLEEAASAGAAILAGVGIGLFPDMVTGAAQLQKEAVHLAPDADRHNRYKALYAIYQSVHPLFHKGLTHIP
jgi:xylulokinase